MSEPLGTHRLENLVGSLKQAPFHAWVRDLEANHLGRRGVPTFDGGFVWSRSTEETLFHLPRGLIELALRFGAVDDSSGKSDGKSIRPLIGLDAPKDRLTVPPAVSESQLITALRGIPVSPRKRGDIARFDRPPEYRQQIRSVCIEADDSPEQDRPDRLGVQEAPRDRRISRLRG